MQIPDDDRKRKFFGPNAKMFVLQFVVGIGLLFVAGPYIAKGFNAMACGGLGWCPLPGQSEKHPDPTPQ